MRPTRVVIAKPGLDGHDRGAKVIARALRDAGMEVIYTGLRQTPEQIAAAALQEDADVIGLSILSGAHMHICPRLMELLREKGLDHVTVLVGGIIPDVDIPKLKAMGIAGVFLPGSPMQDIIEFIHRVGAAARRGAVVLDGQDPPSRRRQRDDPARGGPHLRARGHSRGGRPGWIASRQVARHRAAGHRPGGRRPAGGRWLRHRDAPEEVEKARQRACADAWRVPSSRSIRSGRGRSAATASSSSRSNRSIWWPASKSCWRPPAASADRSVHARRLARRRSTPGRPIPLRLRSCAPARVARRSPR